MLLIPAIYYTVEPCCIGWEIYGNDMEAKPLSVFFYLFSSVLCLYGHLRESD